MKDMLDHWLEKDAKEELEFKEKGFDELDKMMVRDLREEEGNKEARERLLNALGQLHIIDKNYVAEIRNMPPKKGLELAYSLFVMEFEIKHLLDTGAIRRRDAKRFGKLPAKDKLAWKKVLQNGHLQYELGWLTQKEWKQIRERIGTPAESMKNVLIANGDANMLIEKMLKKGQLSQEEAKEYREMSPIKARNELQTRWENNRVQEEADRALAQSEALEKEV